VREFDGKPTYGERFARRRLTYQGWKADRHGNLVYREQLAISIRNGDRCGIDHCRGGELVEPGQLDADQIVTPVST